MGEAVGAVHDQWHLRSVPEDVARRYHAEGWWDDTTLGAMVATGLGGQGSMPFQVRSKVRPWRGTFADVEVCDAGPHHLSGTFLDVTALPRHRTRIPVLAS